MEEIKIKYYGLVYLSKRNFYIYYAFFLCLQVGLAITFTIYPLTPFALKHPQIFRHYPDFIINNFNFLWVFAFVITVIEGQLSISQSYFSKKYKV